MTGLILAGGQGSRMGGVDKGLVPLRGRPLVEHVLERLRPQVGSLMISANRNLAQYRTLDLPVWPDELTGHPGPLAGLAAGLSHSTTTWLVTAPCDTPGLPDDLVARLAAAAVAADAEIAMAATPDDSGRLRSQPVFALVCTGLLDSLRAFLDDGGRRVEQWMQAHRRTVVRFEDAAGFRGANTRDELERL